MAGMELYVRFVFASAAGLAGLGLVLTIMFDTILRDWDPVVDASLWWRRLTQSRPHAELIRAEDLLDALEGRGDGRYESRPARTIDRRREALRKMREAEERLASPAPVETL